LASLTILGSIAATGVQADPAEDALAKLNELSHQAEIATENMHAAQLDLDEKLAAQRAAEEKHAADLAAATAAKEQLATFQASVDRIAAAQYMGGRTDGLDAMLTASSPQVLIDQLAVQRVMATEMSAQMQNFRTTSLLAADAESASARSAADAKTAAEQAAAVRADLQSKQSKLQVEIAIVKAQYEMLTPAQRETLAAIPPVPEGVQLPPPAPLPADDPAVLAAPPAGIPPGDVAPPPAAAPGSSGGVVAMQAALTPARIALLVGCRGTRRLRLLGPGEVGLRTGRHRAGRTPATRWPPVASRCPPTRCSRVTWCPTTRTPHTSASTSATA
jgi:hypothetical protein